jgi:hypothetical protein
MGAGTGDEREGNAATVFLPEPESVMHKNNAAPHTLFIAYTQNTVDANISATP